MAGYDEGTARSEGITGMEWRTVNRAAMDDLLHRLENEGGETTWVVPPGVGRPSGAPWLERGVIGEALAASATGGVVFSAGTGGWLVIPPFPLQELTRLPGWNGAPLHDLLHKPFTIGALLLRLEGYSVGVFRDDQLVDSRTGGRWIHGRNRAGGQSQHRFEHTRDKHIRELYDDACAAARDKFEPFRAELDWIALGGDRLTLHAFRQRCTYLGQFDDRILPGIISIVAPKRDTLARLPYELTKCRVLEVPPDADAVEVWRPADEDEAADAQG